MSNFTDLIDFVRETYNSKEFIPLHAPVFLGNEISYVTETITSTFVSSVGSFVDDFEVKVASYTGAGGAVATVNGTAALHASLHLAGVKHGDLVLTQALTFVATCNALLQLGADPVFIDVSRESLGLDPLALEHFLETEVTINDNGECIHGSSGRRVQAVVPMHTFGHPVDLDELVRVCAAWNLTIVEDAAESLGSFYKGAHTGTVGEYGTLSFNGNKTITTGGGGMILCRNAETTIKAKHVTTTAKQPHKYEYFHDQAAFNYRLPNLNAALGCAQMEILEKLLADKRKIAEGYRRFFLSSNLEFIVEPEYAHSNYWLNAVLCDDRSDRDALLQTTNDAGVMTRPVWTLMHRLPMFENCIRGDLSVSEMLEARLVNLPSSARIQELSFD